MFSKDAIEAASFSERLAPTVLIAHGFDGPNRLSHRAITFTLNSEFLLFLAVWWRSRIGMGITPHVIQTSSAMAGRFQHIAS